MSQKDLAVLLFDNALEIVLAFDDKGLIIYGNTVAHEKLEYGEDLEGVPMQYLSECFQERRGQLGSGMSFGKCNQPYDCIQEESDLFSDGYAHCKRRNDGHLFVYGAQCTRKRVSQP